MSKHDQRLCQPTATWELLRLRAQLLKVLRSFFDKRGFLEVETPLLSADTVVDRYIDPIMVELPDPGQQTRWLQTSPEFGMKRLLSAGAPAIYQVAKAFRAGERGPLHNPEFTIVEWYRKEDTPHQAMQTLSDLIEVTLGQEITERISYRDAFLRNVGLDPHTATLAQLHQVAKERELEIPESLGEDHDEWLNLLLAELVAPELGKTRPTILFDYPAGQSALARLRSDDPPVAVRFELYLNGIELANGYHELCDPVELRERIRATNLLRQADGNRLLPEESLLLQAMEHGLPDSCGVALGFDRLVMLASKSTSIDEVLAFPFERA
ncbi:MAG: EF-P lysine aminoacylase GenX [Planctomycetaceae bacterium]|nr:EF-P lysine aminoacylase GenX [Planctomycetaceae bacterium]